MSRIKGVVVKTTNPAVTDDSDEGYYIGFRWINTSTMTEYEIFDATVGAAVWIVVALGSGFLQQRVYSLPLSEISDSQICIVGEDRTETTGQTGDYATDFAVSNQHVTILVNSITTGGDIVITGTSIDESTGVPSAADTETITVDTTASQLYKTAKKWWEITNIDITTGTIVSINYDVGVLGYDDFGNRTAEILGYRCESRSQSSTADFAIQMVKVQDDGAGKTSLVTIEDYGIDSGGAGNQVIDALRTGLADRSYTPTVANIWLNNTMVVLKAGDFNTFFSGDENIIDGTTDEGFILCIVGAPSGDISEVDYLTIRIDYILQ